MAKYQIVTNNARKAEIIEADHHPIVAFAERGYVLAAYYNGPARAELQGQPQFHGLLGPMWGGNDGEFGGPIIRYEDQSSYDVLSA
jgi:hypothetical protein